MKAPNTHRIILEKTNSLDTVKFSDFCNTTDDGGITDVRSPKRDLAYIIEFFVCHGSKITLLMSWSSIQRVSNSGILRNYYKSSKTKEQKEKTQSSTSVKSLLNV